MNKCLNCQSDTTNPKYCNRSCSASANNRKNPKRSLSKQCASCVSLIPSSNKYCSACWNLQNRLNESKSLEEIQNKASYQINSQIRQLARAKMKRNKIPYRCAVCNYNLHCEVCHVKPINSFDKTTKIEQINSLDNMIYLCRNHHWELDNGLIKL